MKVIKRSGEQEDVKLEKIHSRIIKNCYGLNTKFVEPLKVAMKVISGLKDGITTEELDNLAAEQAAALVGDHPDYSKLAARISLTSLYKSDSINKSFFKTIETLYNNVDPNTKEAAPLVSDEVYEVAKANKSKLNSVIIRDRDNLIDYFGFKTLERSYLLKSGGKIIETPQHMFMRVAIGIHGNDIEKVIETYNFTSEKWFTHATPTLFNAGTRRAQMSSCFLVANKSDSLEGLFDTLGNVAKISKWAGGIGLHIHDVRVKGSYIKGTGGKSDGIVPMLKTYNEVARWINQGGKRKGSFAIYLEPWHADIFEFLDLRKNHGKEEMRARDLFLALWTCDLFMERVEAKGDWTLMCPSECPGLSDVHGAEFNALYEKYESEGRGKKTVAAQDLWYKILESQMETGTPYMLYKDAANAKSNQQNLGTIKSSNLCTEIIEYSEPGETAVCNLASLALPMCVDIKDKRKKVLEQESFFDFEKLSEITTVATKNLNIIIDKNYYPIPETKKSNSRHRPIGLGVQGLADVFQMMGVAFDSDEAKQLNKDIFETIYFAALKASLELAKEHGAYETFEGSPASKGILQFDMWNENGEPIKFSEELSYDWETLKAEIKEHGIRNSLLLAPMPTASCQMSDTQIITNKLGEEKVLSYQEIMDERNVDWREIEKTSNPHWIKLESPVVVKTMNGDVATDKMYYNGHKEVFEIEMEDGEIFKATANHQFYVNRGAEQVWVRVDELEEEDDIVCVEEFVKVG